MALRLEIETGGAAVLDILDRLTNSVGDLAKNQDALTKSVLQLVNGSDAVTRSVDRQAQAASKAVNPWERLKKAQEEYQAAVAKGDADAAKMAELKLARAESTARRADNVLKRRENPMAYALQDMVMTSRFKMGPLMPLVGKAKAAGLLGDDFMADLISKVTSAESGSVAASPKSASSAASATPGFDLSGLGKGSPAAARAIAVAGGGGAGGAGGAAASGAMRVLGLLGVVGVALGGLALALKKFVDVTMFAKDAIGGYGSARFAAGGGPNFGRLAGLGGALGLGPGQMAGMARGWAEGAWGDIFAMSEMSAAGISPVPAKYGGSTDYSGKFLQMLERLVNMPDEASAFRSASRAGMDLELLGLLRTADKNVVDTVLNDSMMFDPLKQREAANATLMYNKLLSESKVLIAKIGQEGLPLLNGGLAVALQMMRATSSAIGVSDDILYAIHPLLGDMLRRLTTGIDPRTGSANGKSPHIDSNTRALRDLTGAVTDLTGAIGWGAGAARGALPQGATRFETIESYYKGQSVALGAIVL
jgi:hypothetical protein